jgi:hypothetical protein
MEPKTYQTLVENITSALIKIHSDYKKNGFIESLRTYDGQNVLSYGYLRKLIEMGILTNVGSSKKTARYQWNGGEKPDYDDLAVKVIDYQLKKAEPVEGNKKQNLLGEKTKMDAIIGLTLKLQKMGLSDDEIKKEVPEMLKLLSI